MVIDDVGLPHHYYAGIVLNQNLGCTEELYPDREPYTKLLLGCRYTLLRRELRQLACRQRVTPEIPRKILITIGRLDPCNATLLVIRSLQLLSSGNLHLSIIVGDGNPHARQLQREQRRSCLSVSTFCKT